MGLLDSIDDPQTLGLLSMGLRLMSTPGKFGQAFGQAGMGALGDVQQARQQQEQRQARKAAQEQATQAHQLQQQLGQQQLLQAQQQAEQQAKQRAFLANLQNPAQAALNGGGGPTQANAAKIDPLQELMFNGVKQGVIPLQAYLASLQKDETPIALGEGGKLVTRGGREIASNPKAPDLNSLVVMGPDGKPMLNQLAIDAKTRIARAGASNTSVSYGTPVAGVDASGNPVFIQPTKDGSAPYVVPGVRPPKSAAEEKAEQEKQARERTGRQMLSALDDAESILKGGKATASGVGNVADAAARAVGVSTAGAQDAARLEALSGWLVSNVPRMEGPQSNYDVQNYMTMAGKVGDRTTPIAERLAALKEVRRLQGKYAAINGSPAKPQERTVTRTGTLNGRKVVQYSDGTTDYAD